MNSIEEAGNGLVRKLDAAMSRGLEEGEYLEVCAERTDGEVETFKEFEVLKQDELYRVNLIAEATGFFLSKLQALVKTLEECVTKGSMEGVDYIVVRCEVRKRTEDGGSYTSFAIARMELDVEKGKYAFIV